MAKFNVDFTEAKEFMMCASGEQNFKITEAELKTYVKDGVNKQKIELTCEVFGGESSGAKVFHSLFLTNPTGLYMFLNKIGAKVEKKAYANLDTNMFVGKTFVAQVDHEKASNGKVYPRIVDTTIRKYVDMNNSENTPDGLSDDAFAEFGDSIEISESDIAF